MFRSKHLVAFALSVFLATTTLGQSVGQSGQRRVAIPPLTVEKGFPLKVVLTEKLRSKLNEPVHGRIVDSVYAMDREVIPAGTEILGKVTALRPVGKWKRISSLLGGDFTPLHDPQITFDTLVFADGKQIPIETSATPQGNVLVRLRDGKVRAYTTSIQQPGKEMLHGMLWRLSPYHPQFVPTGTVYKATLLEPLDFGFVFYGTRILNGIGSEPPAGSIIYARLMTAVDSKKTKPGTEVRAVLTHPLYSLDHRLIFPAGSRLQGEVAESHAAGFLGHGGKLSIKFTKIEPPLAIMSSMSQIQEIQGRLVGVDVPTDLNQLRIDGDGVAQVPTSKQRFLAPAFALAGAAPLLAGGSSSVGGAFAEGYSTSLFSRMLGGADGLGLPANVAGLIFPPVGLGLGAYAVGYATYFNILGHGKNIVLPVDTTIEVRVDGRAASDDVSPEISGSSESPHQ
jgi:hypothetical protein